MNEDTQKNVKSIGLKEILSSELTVEKVKDISFEQGVVLLDELVAKVESGSLALDKAIIAYERGVTLVAHLRSLVSGAEQKLKVLQKA